MTGDLNLAKLPPYGRTFVALFVVLVMIIIIWMVIVGFMEAGLIGAREVPITYEEYDISSDIRTIMDDEQAVTVPNWADSGKQVPIKESDLKKFKGVDPQKALPFTAKFKENVKMALEHISSQALLFFALGVVFMLTTYSSKTKRFFYWLLGILLILHVLGLSGHGFCWPANMLMWVCGPLILIGFFIMAVMVLVDMRGKGA